MWTTRDGYQLRLPAGVKLPAGRAALIGRAASGATLTTLLDRTRGTPRSVLESRIGARPLTLVARVGPSDDLVLEALHPGAPTEDEFEAVRSFNLTLHWGHVPRARSPKVRKPGVYILERVGFPVYVGQSLDVGRLWAGRLLTLEQLRLDTCPGSKEDVLRVGVLTRQNAGPAPAVTSALLRGVEHLVIRQVSTWLARNNAPPLTNRLSVEKFRAGPGGVSLRNLGRPPQYIRDQQLAENVRSDESGPASHTW